MMTLEQRYKWLLESIGTPPWDIPAFTDTPLAKETPSSTSAIANNWHTWNKLLNVQFKLLWQASDLGKFPDKSGGIECLPKAFPVNSIGAKVSKYPEGALILFNKGLFEFALIYLSILLRSSDFQNRMLGEEYRKISFTHEEEISMLASLFYEYIKHAEIEQSRNPDIFQYIIEKSDTILYPVYITIAQEFQSFILSHELAHIRMGHLTNAGSKRIHTSNAREIDTVDFGWPDEMEADAYAAIVMFNPNRVRSHGRPPLDEEADQFLLPQILSGIALFFNIARAIEYFSDQVQQHFGILLPLSHLHPPAKQRMSSVLDALSNHKVIPKDLKGMGMANIMIEQHYSHEKEIWEHIKKKF